MAHRGQETPQSQGQAEQTASSRHRQDQTLGPAALMMIRCRPLAFSRVRMTVVSDPAKALALAQELSVLLAKGAIEPVDPLLQSGGFYSA
ncbi:hypothetical protein NQZ68_026300 [Dissostichus eleginoides]|nr:hypothetical protein NQZ68_026300 [Dissostichus eleginoides]